MLLTFITFITIVSSYSTAIVSRDEKDFADLRNQKADSLSNGFLITRNLTSPRRRFSKTTTSTTLVHTKRPKKWKVERITKKQYEVINVLWRKTKIFLNVENSTREGKQINFTKKVFDASQKEHQIAYTTRPLNLQPVTPSYIEFYYADESVDQVKKQDCVNTKCQPQNSANSSPNPSFLVFHIKGPYRTRTKTNYHSTLNSSIITLNVSNDSANKPTTNKYKAYPKNVVSVPKTNKATKGMIQAMCKTNTESESSKNIAAFTVKKYQTESTTVYDKIKFFELYDKLTQIPFGKEATILEFDSTEHTDEEIKKNNVYKILLEHVDQSSHEHNEAKLSKKHISVENNKNSCKSCIDIVEEIPKPKAYLLNISTERQNNMTSLNGIIQSEKNKSKNIYSYINDSVSWLEYPFAAVYIYEPAQLHCDAASISAHWLVASGSCLSRLNQNPLLGDGRSAFVAYCGDSWWQPERVSYVKYSVVHPWYHPRDQTRRNLYNIGLIQVVTSMMSACSDWAPVSLMSHKYVASREGSEATAVGWGLDRYDTRYASMDLPKGSLKIYKGLLLMDLCPGNVGYSKVKLLDGEGGIKNVYCLSLPPYLGEESDPVHGSLLLVNGKLIALFLQEERRPWGEQSAQYTGVWHLIPWVVEVAREPDEMESFAVEI